jgi:hypothetical protein
MHYGPSLNDRAEARVAGASHPLAPNVLPLSPE